MDSWSLVVIAAVIAAYAAVSRRLTGTAVTAAMVFVAAGFVLGTEGVDWLHGTFSQHSVSVLAEATLVVVLFVDASRIDLRALRREYAVPARLLGFGLPLTIVAGTVAAMIVLPSLSAAEALVLAIVLAPTDAALGQAVVTDPRLPSRIRQGLNVESGLNDGLCVPLLTIALAIASTEAGTSTGAHATQLVFEAIGWGVFGGAVAGVAGGALLRLARTRGTIADHWIPVVPAMAALAAFGIADALGGSGFIAAFVGGVAFGRLTRKESDATLFTEQIGGVLNAATLIVFGAAVLGGLWHDIGAREVAYAVVSLTVVRMVPVAIAMIKSGARPPTIAFLGWFGPRGLASIVFGVVVVEAANVPHVNTLTIAITVTVALSVFAHGATAAPLSRRYAAWCDAAAAQGLAEMESVPVAHQRPRFTPFTR